MLPRSLPEDEALWVWRLADETGPQWLEDQAMADDALGIVITAAMVALLRLIDAWIAVQSGLPLESLKPADVAELDREAEAYVNMILADRKH